MCEMLGMSAKRKRRANGLLREFYSHAEAHPHGWGLARFPAGAAPAVEKEAVKALKDSDGFMDAMKGIAGEVLDDGFDTPDDITDGE